MPEFRLDTGDVKRHTFYDSLPELAKGYIEAAFFSGFEYYNESGDVIEVSGIGLYEIPMALLEAMASDAICFQIQNDSELTLVCSGQDYSYTQAGHDFWFTRNGCGVGYWDRPIDPDINGACEACEAFESLTVAATDEGEFSLSVKPLCAGADPSDPAQWVIEADFMPKHLDKF